MQNKVLCLFGLIKKNCSKFNDTITCECLLCLYTSLIKSQLEYTTKTHAHSGYNCVFSCFCRVLISNSSFGFYFL